jgi:hypothetical protein
MPGAGLRYDIRCGGTLSTPSVTATTRGSSLAAWALPDAGGRYTVHRVATTNIPVAHAPATQAIARGHGQDIALCN